MSDQRLANVHDSTGDEAEVADLIEPLDDATANTASADTPTGLPVLTPAEPDPPLAMPSLAEAPDDEARAAMLKLSGYATSVGWLPEGLSPEVDALRAKHINLVEELGRMLAQCAQRRREIRKAITAREKVVRAAVRAGQPPPEEQAVEITDDVDESHLWATIVVLAEVVTEAISVIQASEAESLASLAEPLAEANAKVAEAQRLLAESRRDAWQVAQVAGWVLQVGDGGALARQPAPRRADPPPTFSGDVELSRPWWRRDRQVVA